MREREREKVKRRGSEREKFQEVGRTERDRVGEYNFLGG